MPALNTRRPSVANRPRQRRAPLVRPAVQDDFEQIVQLADSTRRPTASSLEDKLVRHFGVPWQANNSPGFALVSGDEVVGFLASLTHQRTVRGEQHTICNLGSWFVNSDFRRYSLSLVREALRRQDITYTAVSPIPRVAKISVHFGFEAFETYSRTIYPSISYGGWRPQPKVTVGNVSSLLSGESLKIFRDHERLPCEHAVIEHDGRQCYMVLVRKTKRLRSSAAIHYVSDSTLFCRCIPHLSGQLCRKLRVMSLHVHDRFLGDTRVPFSKRRRLEFPHMYRSPAMSAMEIDNLYSERVVMGF